MIKIIVLVASLIMLSGCISQDYTREQFGSSLTETQLSRNVWKVTFSGGSGWSMAKAEDQALLRSADITFQKGYNYFVMASTDKELAKNTVSTPVTSTQDYSFDEFGIMRTTVSNVSGGGSYSVNKPRVSYTIEMFKEKPDVQGIVYGAQFICDSLGRKLDAQCGTF